ncbi:MAG: hypothetical protein GXY10_01975 [Clostridiales bacterium]|jgi:hypothetical protein|nr:hypothetical protein [Clostridiales bacterium]
MKMTLKKNLIILTIVLLMTFLLTVPYTGAKYAYEEQYNFKVVTPPAGYSYVFVPEENSESQLIAVSLQAYLAGTNRVNVYNLTGNTVNSLSITINYRSTVKNKNSTARFSLYNSSGTLIRTSSNITFRTNRTENVTLNLSSFSLANDGYVYLVMSGVTLNTPNSITLNSLTVSIA